MKTFAALDVFNVEIQILVQTVSVVYPKLNWRRARLWSVLYVDVVVVLVDAMRARQQFGYVHYEKILHGSYQNYQHFPLVYSWIPELYRITFRKIF